jgi:hypothetical protein
MWLLNSNEDPHHWLEAIQEPSGVMQGIWALFICCNLVHKLRKSSDIVFDHGQLFDVKQPSNEDLVSIATETS